MKHLRNKKNMAISDMLAALILIAIVAFAGIMLFLMTSNFFRGGGRASLTLVASGSGSSDGNRATINLVVQNTGDSAALIEAIYVVGESQGASPSSVYPSVFGTGTTTASIRTATAVPTPGASAPAGAPVIDAKSTRTIYIQVGGQGLYPGAQLRVYVVYWDAASRQPAIADTVVTLR